MDVEAVLQSVQERDKWQRRLDTLVTSLGSIVDERRRVQRQLRKIRSELRRLGAYSEALLDRTRSVRMAGTSDASSHPRIPAR